jgi:class 3 adenylate cyclase
MASRMKASSETGRINISGAAYALVKETFKCEYRGKVMAKNIGEVDMYFVQS